MTSEGGNDATHSPIIGLDASQRDLWSKSKWLRQLWENPTGNGIHSRIFKDYPILREKKAHPLELGEKGRFLLPSTQFFVVEMCTAGTGEALIQMTAGKMTREGVVQAMKATPLKVVVDNTNGDDLLHPERAIPGQEISLPQGKHVYFIPNPATPTAKS